jgi:hypothetical protein
MGTVCLQCGTTELFVRVKTVTTVSTKPQGGCQFSSTITRKLQNHIRLPARHKQVQ